MKFEDLTIEMLFSNRFYEIPPYQREYAWGQEQLESLFNDILENDKGYFLGSLICIESEIKENKTYEVIDGQQRLTTISILNTVLCKYIHENKKEWDNGSDNSEERTRKGLNLKDSILDYKSQKLRLELSIQNSNNIDYKYLCDSYLKLNKGIQIPSHYGKRRIKKAFDYFSKRLEEFNMDEVFDFLEKLNSAMLLMIKSDSCASAFTLFESINNRGIPLTPIDLIKNLVISNMEKYLGVKPEDTNNNWQIIINNIPGYSEQVRFLRHYYHAYQQDSRVKHPKYTKATKTNIIKIYEEHIEDRKKIKFIFEDLIRKSEIYKFLVNPVDIDKEDYFAKYKDILIDLNRVGIAPAHSLLLFLFVKYPNEDLFEILQFIEKWFIRRHITDFPSTRDLDQIFLDLIKQIYEEPYYAIYKKITDFLSIDKRNSKDDNIVDYFMNNDMYKANKDSITRYILIKLEKSKRDKKEENINFWDEDQKRKPVWSIEHILPQNPSKNSGWHNYFNNDEISEYVHKLGNLTLTCYNPSLSNRSFSEKYNHENGYKTGRIKINEFLKNKEEWTKDCIAQRTEELAYDLLNLISLNS